MYRIVYTILVLVVGCSQLSAQISLERQLIGSYGALFADVSIQVSATGGEPATQTLSNDDFVLNQGFQQAEPEDLTSVFIASDVVSDLSVFPNPCQGQCWVNITAQIQGEFQLQAIDLYGRSIAHWDLEVLSDQELLLDIPTQSWPPGIYLLKLSDRSGRLLGSLRLAR
ncbi:MAG: hypothetical protein AAGF87_09895 [Bacteroidota bacterium]